MEEKLLKIKYNELLNSYKKGSEYFAEHQDDEKAKIKLEKIETELSNLIQALPDITEQEKTEGFVIEKPEILTLPNEKTNLIKEIPQPANNLSSFKDNWEMATQLSKSDIIPENYRNKPANVVVAIGIANQMQLDPFIVMQNLAFIKGKTSWSGSFCRTLIERTGKFKDLELNYIGEKDKDSYGCYLSAIRLSDGKKIDGPVVNMAMAKAEKWTSNPKWTTMKDLMLAYRCQSYFCRIHCPEAMTGIYTSEEIEDINTTREQPKDIL